MAARGLSLADAASPAQLPQRKAAAEAVPRTQQRLAVLADRKGRHSRSCKRHAVAEAPPAQAPEALQLEVCFEAPPENYVPPTRIQTKGRIVASAFPQIYCVSRHESTTYSPLAATLRLLLYAENLQQGTTAFMGFRVCLQSGIFTGT